MNSRETLSSCRRSDEQTLFDCFERQDTGDNCCGSARTSECLQVSNTFTTFDVISSSRNE